MDNESICTESRTGIFLIIKLLKLFCEKDKEAVINSPKRE